MIDYLDILELTIKVSQGTDDIPDTLFSKILDNEVFESVDKGADIFYIIVRCFHHINFVGLTENDIQLWINKKIEQLTNLSRFSYNENDKLILSKFIFYEYCIHTDIINKLDILLKDIDNILSIQINEKNAIWLAKEQIRFTLLKLFSMNAFDEKYFDFIQNQLAIARAHQEERNYLLNKYTNIMTN